MTNQNKLFFASLLFIILFVPLTFATELKIVKVSDLKVGDVIVDKNGNEITIETLKTQEKPFKTIGQIINGLVTEDETASLNIYTGSGQDGPGIALSQEEVSQYKETQQTKSLWERILSFFNL